MPTLSNMAFFVTALLVLALLEPGTGHGGGHHSSSSSHGSRHGSGGPNWDYAGLVLGPSYWRYRYSICGREGFQSPININTQQAVHDASLEDFNLYEYTKESDSFELENNGHTVEMVYTGSSIAIRDGGLGDVYLLDQFHFHWGSTNFRGSEHQVDGKAAPLEMHIVHHRKGYHREQAATMSRGLAVLSFLFEVSEDENKDFEALLKAFERVTYRDQKTELEEFSLAGLLPKDAEKGNYYRYNGSLTTPPCYESVIWTVFEQKISISGTQLEAFRKLQTETASVAAPENHHHLWDNYRHPQPLMSRTVYYKNKDVNGNAHSSNGYGPTYPGHYNNPYQPTQNGGYNQQTQHGSYYQGSQPNGYNPHGQQNGYYPGSQPSAYNPHEQQPYNPHGQQPYNPHEQQPYNPHGQQPYNQQQQHGGYYQGGSQPGVYNPNGQQPSNQHGQQPYKQHGQQPYNQHSGQQGGYYQGGQQSGYNQPGQHGGYYQGGQQGGYHQQQGQHTSYHH